MYHLHYRPSSLTEWLNCGCVPPLTHCLTSLIKQLLTVYHSLISIVPVHSAVNVYTLLSPLFLFTQLWLHAESDLHCTSSFGCECVQSMIHCPISLSFDCAPNLTSIAAVKSTAHVYRPWHPLPQLTQPWKCAISYLYCLRSLICEHVPLKTEVACSLSGWVTSVTMLQNRTCLHKAERRLSLLKKKIGWMSLKFKCR